MKKLGLVIIWMMIFFFGYRSYLLNVNQQNVGIQPEESDVMDVFMSEVEYKEILAYATDQLNEDTLEDAVVIYTLNDNSRRFSVVYSLEGDYCISGEKAAPVDNQKIEVRNIDDEIPKEFIISGSKNGHYGYSIFRIEDSEVVDIFGEGMDDCC